MHRYLYVGTRYTARRWALFDKLFDHENGFTLLCKGRRTKRIFLEERQDKAYARSNAGKGGPQKPGPKA